MKKILSVSIGLLLLLAGCGEAAEPVDTQSSAIAAVGHSAQAAAQATVPADTPTGILYQESSYPSPDEAINAYIAGIAAGDLAQALSACAIDSYGEGVDIHAWVELMQMYRISGDMGPSDQPLFAELNTIMQLGTLAKQTKVFVECLTSGGESEMAAQILNEGGWTGDSADESDDTGAPLDEYFLALDPEKLGGITVDEILTPPVLEEAPAEIVEVMAHNARLAGADESTQRVVILNRGEKKAICSFQLLRYGEDWKIVSHGAPLLNLASTGVSLVVSPEEVEEFKADVLVR